MMMSLSLWLDMSHDRHLPVTKGADCEFEGVASVGGVGVHLGHVRV